MTIINRTSLSDWNSYLSENVVVSDTLNGNIELPNGPYNTLDDAKAEVTDLIFIYDHVLVSDLNVSNVFELSPDKNSLVMKTTRKSTTDGHRPLAEAGAPLATLDVEFNIFNYQNEIRKNSKCAWIQGIKKFSDLDTYNKTKISRTKEAVDKGFDSNASEVFDVTDQLFKLLNTTNKESNYENSFLAVKKTISDPPTSNIVHYMNHCNMTFVFQSSATDVCDNYETYLRGLFSLDNQYTNWHDDLKQHFMIPGYSWHCREMYHLTEDYYAITISKNSMCSNSHRIMNDLIVNHEKLSFDWKRYPGNLYIGNVCKILKS